MFRVPSWAWCLVLLPSLALAGCNTIVEAMLESDAELPVKNEPGLVALGTAFSDMLKAGDFAGAYGLCSSQLKTRQTEEQFVAEMKGQWQKLSGGVQPRTYDITPYMPYEDEFEEWEGMPKDIKYSALQGQITVMFATKLEDEEIVEGFDLDLFAVEEGGQLKVAYAEFYDYSE
jgi:hypothetical protein